MLDHCLALLASQRTLVLATAGEDGPHTSLMAYLAAADGREIVMATRSGSRKWANLCAEPRVSLLVDDRSAGHSQESTTALTLTGTAQRPAADAEGAALERLVQAHPHLAPIVAAPDARAIVVRPASLLLLQGPVEAFYHRFEDIHGG